MIKHFNYNHNFELKLESFRLTHIPVSFLCPIKSPDLNTTDTVATLTNVLLYVGLAHKISLKGDKIWKRCIISIKCAQRTLKPDVCECIHSLILFFFFTFLGILNNNFLSI